MYNIEYLPENIVIPATTIGNMESLTYSLLLIIILAFFLNNINTYVLVFTIYYNFF